jgi:thiamine-phosphate pyrophosphorylase
VNTFFLPRVYWITDRHQTAGRELGAVAEAFCSGGGQLLQLRETGLNDRELLGLAVALRRNLPAGARLLINDRADIALAADADGVHCKVTSAPPSAVRRILPAGALLGASTHSRDEVERAWREGADFAVFGPIYDTPSKRRFGAPVGLDTLRAVAAEFPLPLFALGGVTLARVPEVLRAGAYGVAVIRAIAEAPDVRQATADLIAAVEDCVV